MTALSDYLEDAVLNLTLRGTAFTAITTPYVSLHAGDPGETGANEVVPGANAYVRKAATFGAPATTAAGGRYCANTAALEWANMPAVTVTHVGIWDALTAGNVLYLGALYFPVTVVAAALFPIPVGALTVELR